MLVFFSERVGAFHISSGSRSPVPATGAPVIVDFYLLYVHRASDGYMCFRSSKERGGIQIYVPV
jgi:hypothetical protein